jgi:hypothetical protein
VTPLALRGAELIFMPAGTDKRRLWATWRNLIWSRAIENLAVVVTTQNMFSHAERGLAMVATPEEILFESTAAGLFVVDVSLDRAREMRATTDTVTSALNTAQSKVCLVHSGSGRNCARPCTRAAKRHSDLPAPWRRRVEHCACEVLVRICAAYVFSSRSRP